MFCLLVIADVNLFVGFVMSLDNAYLTPEKGGPQKSVADKILFQIKDVFMWITRVICIFISFLKKMSTFYMTGLWDSEQYKQTVVPTL